MYLAIMGLKPIKRADQMNVASYAQLWSRLSHISPTGPRRTGRSRARTSLETGKAVSASCALAFPVAWEKIGLRLIQIAQDNDVWVLDMWKIKAVPKEVKRIIESPHIKKTGVGLIKDIAIIWDDLRLEMRNLVDVGMMARLLLAERYPKGSYGNLALKTCAQDVLGFELSKDLSVSDWAADKLDDEQLECLDAIALLRLYEVLEDALMRRRIEINQEIPDAWYRFNSRSGEPTRRKPGYEQTNIVWRVNDCTWYSGGKFIGYHP
ncbi:ribonuclease H-like domain-containing protein [Mycena latifolia]|nr:ribonuclease H-like domain-containing protein [Mycena latifolia]